MSEAEIVAELDRLGDELATVAITADFSRKLACHSDESAVQKLVMMVNVALDTAAGALAELRQKNEQLSEMQRLDSVQRDLITELSAPILEVWDGILGVPIVGRLDVERAGQITATLLEAIRVKQAETVILDLTGVTEFDAVAVESLSRVVRAAKLLGSQVYVVGTGAKLAITLASQELQLDGALMLRSMNMALRDCLR